MTISWGGSISVIDYRCSAGPADKPFVEWHGGASYLTPSIGARRSSRQKADNDARPVRPALE